MHDAGLGHLVLALSSVFVRTDLEHRVVIVSL